MHIPDGFLLPKVWITLDVLAGLVILLAIIRTRRTIGEKQIPLMGVMSAFIFAGQMLNFPVAGGTSGHLLGSVMASVLLGPWAGTLVMTVVFIMQCFLFQDGGLTALGANIFNMGIVGTIIGYLIYKLIFILFGRKGQIIAVAVAGWFSVVGASAATALELGISGVVPLKIVLPAMVGVHCLIGLGEALVTSAVLGLVLKVRPDLVGG